MDGTQNSLGNATQESSPTRNSTGEWYASEAAPREILAMNPPVKDGELAVLAKDLGLPAVRMQENKESLGDNDGKILSESISSSTLEMEPGNALAPHVHQPLENEGIDVEIIDRTPEAKDGSSDRVAAAYFYSSNESPDPAKMANIDTASPFDSVKSAVSKFGGIVDWKAHRVHTVEKRKVIEQELEKANVDIPLYKERAELVEEAKLKVLKELENTMRLVEELKLNLEMAQKEEEQAKQDSELAELRVAEMEQGIADEVSIAAKTQLEVARARHEAVVSELKTAKDEIEQVKKDLNLLVDEKDTSMKKTEEAISRSKEVEKCAEDLTIELIAAKESLESAQVAHLEAEEHRIGAVMAKEQDILNWVKDVKQAEEEVERLTQQLLASKDLKSKLDTATALLQDLKLELAAYMDSKLEQGSGEEVNLQDVSKEIRKGTRANVEAALSAAKKELEQVKMNIEKATDEVNIVMVAATSLRSELEKEKAELAAIQQREGMASIAVASLEAELNRTESEIAFAWVRAKEQREKLVELPKQLQVVAQEAGQAKELEKIASDELRKSKEEAEQAKAAESTVESRLRAVQKETEAANASEKVAMAAINALMESESAQRNNSEDSPTGVTLSLEEYYELSKRAQEAEEQANVRVAAALSQIEVAKKSELERLNNLEEAKREMAEKKESLQIALQKSEKAKEGKLGVEQELRKWRAENQQRRTAGDSISTPKNMSISPKASFEEPLVYKSPDITPNSSVARVKSTLSSYTTSSETDVALEVKVTKKKKKSLFPRFFMFLGRKKSSPSKS